MSFFDKVSALIPFSKKQEIPEYYFAIDFSQEKLTAALWQILGKQLKILQTETAEYSPDQLLSKTDQLLDSVLAAREVEPQKILFGVPNSWLSDDNLKEENLKILRSLVKELELTPMAYVATTHAINHFLEKQDGIPQTAIMVGFENTHLTVTVVRAGKIDGVKILTRGDNTASDIEKALITFTEVETLPSRLLLYGLDQEELNKLKTQLLSFPWMSKLPFLHLPKIEILEEGLEIKSVCLAGATELKTEVVFIDTPIQTEKIKEQLLDKDIENLDEETKDTKESEEVREEKDNFGFMVGNVEEKVDQEQSLESVQPQAQTVLQTESDEQALEIEDFQQDQVSSAPGVVKPQRFKPPPSLAKYLPYDKFTNLTLLIGVVGVLVILIVSFAFLVKAQVKVFVEPKILEKDTQVIADPKQKEVNEETKVIPGQIVEVEVSGSNKDTASGKKQIGDPAKGTVVIYNKTSESKTLSKGTVLTGPSSTKFTLDLSVTIASQSARADGISYGKANATLTASSVGADGNIPSDSNLTIANSPADQISAKSEGNFSGGTSKEVTVVSDADQKRLLASLASDLRKQAQQKLQEKQPDKKILEEALSEQILSKNYNKNINDQASEFSLNMKIKYTGTSFEEKDLKGIVSKLVTTDVPEGFELDLKDTETQADVSRLDKDGKLVFLARFKAKLLPKIDKEEIKSKIRGKGIGEAAETLKSLENILGSEIILKPSLPSFLQRLPMLIRNITVEVGMK